MKRKPTVLLATFVVTLGLLLGASTALAVNVETDDDGNVIRIENLPVIDENTEETTFYNVDFVFDTAINVYGSGLDFDFPDDETIFIALNAVIDALNADPPTPGGAGPQGSDDFFIGNKEEDGLVVAVGGENLAGFWGLCVTNCIDLSDLGIQTGVGVISPNDSVTWADFTLATDVPVAPGKATLISPSGTIDANAPTYTWNAVEGSTWYRLQVNDSTGEKTIYQWYEPDDADCGGSEAECSVTPPTELADGAVKWWIQTWNEVATGPWSDGMSFNVVTDSGTIPGEATLISPSGTIDANAPTYTWNAVENSTYYYLWVDDSTERQRILKWYTADEADCGDGTGECSVTPATELADGAAKWWIQTWNEVDYGPWSDALSFTVDTGTSVPPGKATLTSPSGTIDANAPTYTWNAVENSTWYYLWVNDSTQEEKILEWYTAADAGCGDGTGECSVTPSTELADGAAKWWIQTWNEFGTGPWSAGMSFTVNTGTVDPGVNVETDDDGNVIRITNLPVIDENTEEVTIYNVEFVFDTASNVYGTSLDFDFPDDETIFVALNAVIDALNFADPTPVGAGPQGSDDFFIGNTEEEGLVVFVGGENFAGAWDLCVTDCIDLSDLGIQTSVGVISPNESATWADFTVAD